MDLSTLLAQHNALPSAPSAVARLVQTFSDDDASLDDIVDCIEADPVIVAKLLRMVNSPFFFRGQVVGNVGDAVRLLGMSHARSLVIGLIAKDRFRPLPLAYLDQFWRYSITTAELARHLARNGTVDSEAVYIGALLHEIGGLVMRMAMTEKMMVLDRVCPAMTLGRGEVEQKVLGYSYAEVGAALVREWHLPRRIVSIIETQHTPKLNTDGGREAAMVFLSSWRARGIEMKLRREGQILFLSPVVIQLAEAMQVDLEALMKWTPDFDGATSA